MPITLPLRDDPILLFLDGFVPNLDLILPLSDFVLLLQLIARFMDPAALVFKRRACSPNGVVQTYDPFAFDQRSLAFCPLMNLSGASRISARFLCAVFEIAVEVLRRLFPSNSHQNSA